MQYVLFNNRVEGWVEPEVSDALWWLVFMLPRNLPIDLDKKRLVCCSLLQSVDAYLQRRLPSVNDNGIFGVLPLAKCPR